MKDDIEDRIARALAMKLTSEQVAELLKEVEQASVDSDKAFEAAKAKALDPATRLAAVAEARRSMEDEQFKAARFAAAVTRLEAVHAEVSEREAKEAADREYEAARKERDQLAEDIAKEYPKASATIASLLERLQANDLRLDKGNVGRSGEEHLLSAESLARGVTYSFRSNNDSRLPPLSTIQLPKMTVDGIHGFQWPKQR